MSEDKVVSFRQKDEIDDPLTEILPSGAKRLIEQAVEAEFAGFLTVLSVGFKLLHGACKAYFTAVSCRFALLRA
jgi:hypothetical protein